MLKNLWSKYSSFIKWIVIPFGFVFCVIYYDANIKEPRPHPIPPAIDTTKDYYAITFGDKYVKVKVLDIYERDYSIYYLIQFEDGDVVEYFDSMIRIVNKQNN